MIYAVIASSLVSIISVVGLVFVVLRLLDQISGERARHRDEVAELTNKIQYPQIYQPTPSQARVPDPPSPPQDDFEKVGQILPDWAEDEAEAIGQM